MRINLGAFDRWLRIIVGLVIMSLVFWGPESKWGWLGLIPFLTGLAGNCPLYQLFGWSTGSPNPRSTV